MPEPETRGLRAWELASLTAGALLLVVPFAAILLRSGYSLARPEAGLGLAILAGVGLLAGFWLAFGGRLVAALVAAALIPLFTDLLWGWIGGWPGAVLAAAAAGAAAWWLGPRLGVALVAATLAAGVATVAAGGPGSTDPSPEAGPGPVPGDAPPLRVHLVLDDQLGLDGIPMDIDGAVGAANALEAIFLRNGFRIFSRAYGRHLETADSLASIVNFDATSRPSDYLEDGGGRLALAANAYFDEMARRGYRIHVIQSDGLDFCASAGAALASCFTYDASGIGPVESSDLPTWRRLQVIAGITARRSFLARELREAYMPLARWRWLRAQGVRLPEWYDGQPVASLAVPAVVRRIAAEASSAGPGSMFFAHLRIPAPPYAFSPACRIKGLPTRWPWENTGKRSTRYPAYLDQSECAARLLSRIFKRMKEVGVYDDAVVIVHGDQGSRIVNARRPLRHLVAQFSTFFAVKAPGLEPGLDERLLAVDALLPRLARDASLPPGSDWAGPALVYAEASEGNGEGPSGREPRPLPDFAAGQPR